MSLYEDWMKKAFSQEGRSIEAVWEEYLPKEQKIYEYILGEKVTKLEGTIAELAARFDMTAEMIVAFIDGLNASLEEPFDMETLAEDTKVCINIDFEKLYKLMIPSQQPLEYVNIRQSICPTCPSGTVFMTQKPESILHWNRRNPKPS